MLGLLVALLVTAVAASAAGTATSGPTLTFVSQASKSISVGAGTLTDTAIIIGDPRLPTPTATIDSKRYGSNDPTCSSPIFTQTGVPFTRQQTVASPSVPVGGSVTVSQPLTPRQVGTYHWRTFYLGDHTNGVVGSTCGDPNEPASQGQSLVAFLLVHVRADKSQVSTAALQILTLG